MKLLMGMGLVVCALAAMGCGHVERYILLQTDPPGAPAWVDEEYVGLTPVKYEFQHYGRRRIRVGPVREELGEGPADTVAETPVTEDGQPVPPDDSGQLLFEATERMYVTEVPSYQVFPIDFFYEVLLPTKRVDRHEVTISLRPVSAWPAESGQEAAEALVEEADAFRQRALAPALESEE